jgi:hypothetical protein
MSKLGMVVKNFKSCGLGLEEMRKGHALNVPKEAVSEFLIFAVRREGSKRVYQKEAEKKVMFWLCPKRRRTTKNGVFPNN